MRAPKSLKKKKKRDNTGPSDRKVRQRVDRTHHRDRMLVGENVTQQRSSIRSKNPRRRVALSNQRGRSKLQQAGSVVKSKSSSVRGHRQKGMVLGAGKGKTVSAREIARNLTPRLQRRRSAEHRRVAEASRMGGRCWLHRHLGGADCLMVPKGAGVSGHDCGGGTLRNST